MFFEGNKHIENVDEWERLVAMIPKKLPSKSALKVIRPGYVELRVLVGMQTTMGIFNSTELYTLWYNKNKKCGMAIKGTFVQGPEKLIN